MHVVTMLENNVHCIQLKKMDMFLTGSLLDPIVHRCNGSSDQPLMVDSLRYFFNQPVLHSWFNKGCGICYSVSGMVHIKISPCDGSGFPLPLSEWSFTT